MNNQPNILLVEDEAGVCLIHKMFLESMGCQVTVAVNSDEAQKEIVKPWDLILMDVGLPGITGIEVVKIYREQEKNAIPTPIVFLTGYQDKETMDKCIAVGGNAVFNKPISRDALKNVVDQYRI